MKPIAASALAPLLALVACCAPRTAPDPAAAGDGGAPVEDAAPSPQDPAAAPEESAWRSALSRSGRLVVAWRPLPDPIPINEDFELEVRLTRPGDEPRPVSGAQVFVRGWMPDHGHGMVREPRSVELGEGLYRVEGMLLHMPGEWDLMVDAVVDDIADVATFELEL